MRTSREKISQSPPGRDLLVEQAGLALLLLNIRKLTDLQKHAGASWIRAILDLLNDSNPSHHISTNRPCNCICHVVYRSDHM